MKTFMKSAGIIAIVFAVLFQTAPAAIAQSAPKVDAAVIDLKQPLPAQLDLIEGQQVVFENDHATFTTAETDGNGTLLETRPHNTLNQAAAFLAKRPGTGEITVAFASQGLLTVAKKYTIKVVVSKPATQPAASKQHDLTYDSVLKSQAPAQELALGDSLKVIRPWTSGDPGLFDPIPMKATFVATDGQTEPVLESTTQSHSFNKNISAFEMWHFKSLRAGSTEIVFEKETSTGWKEVTRVKVKVTAAAATATGAATTTTSAAPAESKHDILVSWTKPLNEADVRKELAAYEISKLKLVQKSNKDCLFQIVITSTLSTNKVVEEISKLPNIEFAEPNSKQQQN